MKKSTHTNVSRWRVVLRSSLENVISIEDLVIQTKSPRVALEKYFMNKHGASYSTYNGAKMCMDEKNVCSVEYTEKHSNFYRLWVITRA